MTTVIIANQQKRQPGCLVQVIWFLLVGSWLSLLAVMVAWLCMLTVVGIPLGIAIVNKLPKLVALREPRSAKPVTVVTTGAATVVTTGAVRQHPFVIRAVWFVLVGWWASLIVMVTAWVLCASIIGMPIGFWLFDRTPGILSLHRA